jgi:hypothetical protein
MELSVIPVATHRRTVRGELGDLYINALPSLPLP